MEKHIHCGNCKSSQVNLLIDLGKQPVSNKFTTDPHQAEFFFEMSLGQCQACGLIQLINRAPVEQLTPAFDWITYVEPDNHLDALSLELKKLNVLGKRAKILGISSKDTSFIERLNKNGHLTSMLDSENLFGVKNAGIEILQDRISRGLDSAEAKGFDLIIGRHILEHSYDLERFIGSLMAMLTESGCLLLEVPDFEKSLNNLDYPSIWEEHIYYFTTSTLKRTLETHGFDVLFSNSYEYPMENALVVIARKNSSGRSNVSKDNEIFKDQELTLGKIFSESFDKTRKKLHGYLGYLDNNDAGKAGIKKIAMVGAGHIGCAFINYFGLKDYFTCFIDDNPNKSGLIMPGCGLKIVGSSIIKRAVSDWDSGLKYLLLGINPRNEQKFLESNQDFVGAGGKFYSIFKNSNDPLPVFHEASDLGLIKKSEEAYFFEQASGIVKVSEKHVQFLMANAATSATKRVRLCAHVSSEDRIHEMIILLDRSNYVRPHTHRNKTESFHIIEGYLDVLLFDNNGKVTDVIGLSASRGSGSNFYYRINKELCHTVVIRSRYAVIHETTNGPFNKDDMVYAEWSPADTKDNGAEVESYINKLRETARG